MVPPLLFIPIPLFMPNMRTITVTTRAHAITQHVPIPMPMPMPMPPPPIPRPDGTVCARGDMAPDGAPPPAPLCRICVCRSRSGWL
jgi:hypothetical protein